MRQLKIGLVLSILAGMLYANEDIKINTCKHTIKCNMAHLYDEEPGNVSTIKEMFSKGMYYGRFRFNSFGFKWGTELERADVKLRENQIIAAMGGSLVFKSATLNGFGVGAGFYMTQASGSLADHEAYLYKAGKGVMSRYDWLTKGKDNISTLAQAYLEYKYNHSSLKIGRQIFESFLTKSNDTKMIPNTFEGLTAYSASLPKTSLKAAYLVKQKLRDHAGFHHLLAVGSDESDPYAIYSENDDTAMHYGLQINKLEAKGIEDRLIIVEAQNRSIENLTLKMNYTAVPELISSAMIQANYRVYLGNWSVIPALRVMQQFDNGAGAIGGANLKTLTQGYSNPDSLDSALYGARIDVVQDAFKLRFGYTYVADEGDIVAPWRGFPTAGFTRAMSQYNWYANTKTGMVQLDYAFESIPNFKIISRFAIQDFDDNKVGVQADSKVFTLDMLKTFFNKSLYMKTRYGHVVGENDTIASNGVRKLDPSYDEIRFEINYLF